MHPFKRLEESGRLITLVVFTVSLLMMEPKIELLERSRNFIFEDKFQKKLEIASEILAFDKDS